MHVEQIKLRTACSPSAHAASHFTRYPLALTSTQSTNQGQEEEHIDAIFHISKVK